MKYHQTYPLKANASNYRQKVLLLNSKHQERVIQRGIWKVCVSEGFSC